MLPRRTRPLTSAGLLILVVACGGSPRADIAIENVTVIDAVNGVREGQTVLVEGGMI